jgi:hypothetical protein
MAGCLSEDEELQQIISLDDTDLDTNTNSSLPVVGTTTGFTVNDLITVLDRVSSSKIKCEAELANTILANTREKKCLNPLCCFVSSLVDAFRECSDRIKKVKNNSIRAIKLEREFSTLRHAKASKLFVEWNKLMAASSVCQDEGSTKSAVYVVYQHVLQYFWSFVALKSNPCSETRSELVTVSDDVQKDEAEYEAIRHAGWAVKRARDQILSASTGISIRKSKNDTGVKKTVSKQCLLTILCRLGTDQRQDSGQFLFIINNAVLDFFIVSHKMVQDFFKCGIDSNTVVQCLKCLSESKDLRDE